MNSGWIRGGHGGDTCLHRDQEDGDVATAIDDLAADSCRRLMAGLSVTLDGESLGRGGDRGHSVDPAG